MKRFIFFVLPVVLGLTLASTKTYPNDGGWARLLGTSDYDSGIAIAVDSNGNSYITGRTRGDLDGNTNAGGQDIFIAKYSANGTKQWVRLLGTSTGDDNGRGITLDSNGNCYITGGTLGDLDGQSNAGGMDIFITKYDSNGNKKWTRMLGTATWERGLGIALDSNGYAYITGESSGDLDGQSRLGFVDIFIVKYDSSGNKQWTRLLGTSLWDSGFDIALDSNSNSYITGKTQGNLDGRIHAGSEDIFVAKYDSSGNKKWTRLFGTSALDTGRSIALDTNGNSYITGFTYGDLDGNTNAGSADIFVAKYDSSGNKKWTRLLGTSDLDFGIGIAVDSDGNRYVTGSTQGDLEDQSNAGGQDILVWKTAERIGGAMPWIPLLLPDD
jgi:hypothetical protein